MMRPKIPPLKKSDQILSRTSSNQVVVYLKDIKILGLAKKGRTDKYPNTFVVISVDKKERWKSGVLKKTADPHWDVNITLRVQNSSIFQIDLYHARFLKALHIGRLTCSVKNLFENALFHLTDGRESVCEVLIGIVADDIVQTPPTAVPDKKSSSSSMERIFCFYQLWRLLLRGSRSPTKRQPLPTELIVKIFRLGDCCVPVPSLSRSAMTGCAIISHDINPVNYMWFHTLPVQFSILPVLQTSVARLEINILSKDQGWASDPSASCSWFELVLPDRSPTDENISLGNPRTIVENGKEKRLSWVFRHNDIACPEWKRCISVIHGNHEVWKYVEAGDVLGVRVCAQYRGWENQAKEGSIQVLRYFEPGVVEG